MPLSMGTRSLAIAGCAAVELALCDAARAASRAASVGVTTVVTRRTGARLTPAVRTIPGRTTTTIVIEGFRPQSRVEVRGSSGFDFFYRAPGGDTRPIEAGQAVERGSTLVAVARDRGSGRADVVVTIHADAE